MGVTIGLTVFLLIAVTLLSVFSYFSYIRAIPPKVVFMMAGIRFRLGTDKDADDAQSLICVDNSNVKIMYVDNRYHLLFGNNKVCSMISDLLPPNTSSDALTKLTEAKANAWKWEGGGSTEWVPFPTTTFPSTFWDVFRTFPVA
jgi:hypothetical protein